MAYTGDPANVPTDAVRLEIGDVNPVLPLLADTEVQYFLDKNNSSIKKAALDAAKTILFKLSKYVRERADIIEYYGSDYFKQYQSALMLYIKDPNFSIALEGATPYAGGISRSDIRNNINNSDNYTTPVEIAIPNDYSYDVNNDSPFYRNNNLPRDDNYEL